jgi:hypothetical protein
MSRVGDLHREAEAQIDRALVAQRAGRVEEAVQLFRAALVLERDAAVAVPVAPEYDLTRAVLYRSAATLALDCNETREAERLARLGLEATSSGVLAGELHTIIDRAREQAAALVGAGSGAG